MLISVNTKFFDWLLCSIIIAKTDTTRELFTCREGMQLSEEYVQQKAANAHPAETLEFPSLVSRG